MSTTLIETERSPTAPTRPYLDEFARREPGRSMEPALIAALRRRGIERFAAVGFPSSRDEEWRFTNVSPILRATFRSAAEAATPPTIGHEALAPYLWSGAAARLVFVDGRFAPEHSFVGEIPTQAFVGRLSEAIQTERAEIFESFGGSGGDREMHGFAALNAALFDDGACVLVPRALRIEAPIHLLFLSSGGTMSFPRNLIVLGEDAQATVVETYGSAGGGTEESLTMPTTEIVARDRSNLRHVKLQRESRQGFHVATFGLRQERGSRVASHSISLGGAIVRNDLLAFLAGEGADCVLNGLYLVDGQQVVDNHMKVDHAAPHCESHELYKGVLDGRARAVFNGLIHVHPGAQKTDAKQSNRNLLLSADAIANSNPQLEIYADDVKCTHGSTVGQLDEDAIFYLRSRGIGLEAARSLLTYAFASELVERIPVEPVRRDLEEFLFSRLPGGEVVRQAV